MSRQKDSSVVLIKLTEATLSKVLREKFIEDEDFNGNNGEDYVSDEAREGGFESDKDLAFDQAEKKTKKMKGLKKVKTFLDILVDALQNSGGDFYTNIEYEVATVGKTFMISVLSETSW